MNTKFLLLLLVSLFVANTTASGNLAKKRLASPIEQSATTNPASAQHSDAGPDDVIPGQDAPHDTDHHAKKHIHHEEDGKHDHHTSGRFRRRQRWSCLLCKIGLAIAYLLSFCYCFEHATHTSLHHFLSACYKTVVFFQQAVS